LASIAEHKLLADRLLELHADRAALRAALLQQAMAPLPDDPAAEMRRILDRIDRGLPATNKSEAAARLGELARDIGVLDLAMAKSQNRIQIGLENEARERAKGADVVAALQRISLAADALAAAEQAARDLVADLNLQGWRFSSSELVGPVTYWGATAARVEDFRRAAERLCGTRLKR
jgi:hypothetical protein